MINSKDDIIDFCRPYQGQSCVWIAEFNIKGEFTYGHVESDLANRLTKKYEGALRQPMKIVDIIVCPCKAIAQNIVTELTRLSKSRGENIGKCTINTYDIMWYINNVKTIISANNSITNSDDVNIDKKIAQMCKKVNKFDNDTQKIKSALEELSQEINDLLDVLL